MSKRLQIRVPNNEYKFALTVAKQNEISMSELVRIGLREGIKKFSKNDRQARLARLLNLATSFGPAVEKEEKGKA